MKYVYSYNTKQWNDWDLGDKLAKRLRKLGYKAKAEMGISLMRVISNAPQRIVDEQLEEIK